MWKVVGVLAVLTIIVVSTAFDKLSDSELFSPALHSARADNLEAQTEALRAQNAHQQRQYELELREMEAKTAVEVQALKERRAIESELLRLAGILGLVTVFGAVLALAFAFSYCLIMTANAPPKEPELVRKQYVHRNRASYDGFLAFCDDFFLSNGRCLPPNYDYGRPDGERKYYPDGISSNVAQSYISILEENAIFKSGANGCGEQVIRRSINTLNDIKLRISRETFDSLQAVRQNGVG